MSATSIDTPTAAGPATTPSGARSGALVATASVVATGANYAFLLAAGRVLGSHDYGSLAALLGALTVVLLPTGALQLAVSREVSRRLAVGDEREAEAFARAATRLAFITTVPLLVVGFALVFPAAALLKIDAEGVVALAAAGLVAAFLFPVALGVLQGYQRFHAVAALYVLPFALRLGFFAVVVLIGFRLGGAVYAAIAGGIVAAAVALTLIEQPLRRAADAPRPALTPFLRYLGPVVLGLIGVAVLTNVDLLVVKARFSPAEAGDYAAAAAFAKVAFFLPATILAVLFPRTAARQARGEETTDILGRSLIVVAGFCAVLVAAYAMAGRGLVHSSFGAEFAEGGELLVRLTFAMSLYTLANILVGFHLSRGERRYAWIVAAAVPAQVALLALVPGGLDGVVWANVGAAAMLLAAHELAVGSSAPALAAGARHLRASLRIPRAVVREAAVVLAVATAFVCIFTWPLAPELGSAFVGSVGADASGTIWWLWHLQQEGGFHLFGTTRHVLGGAPIGFQESNGLNLQWLLPYYPAYLATGVVGEVAAYNLVVLSGFVLSGAAMYVLARYLGCAPLVAAWGALVYIVFPAHVERIEHGSLLHFEALVLPLLAAAAAVARPTGARFALVGLATAAAWLTSGYFGVMGAVGATAFALGAAAVMPGRRTRLVGGTAASALAATVAIAATSLVAGADVGEIRERVPRDLAAYGLRANELVVPPARNVLVGERLEAYHQARIHDSNPSETSNYLGLLTIGLAAVGAGSAWRRRRERERKLRPAVAGFAAVAAVALVLATPSPLDVFGWNLTWTPSRVLWELVPAFRVPARWTLLLMTAAVPVAALGLQQLWTRMERRAAARYGLVAAAMLLSLAELTTAVHDRISPTGPTPPEYAAVARAPGGVLAEYPLRRSDIYSFWQREHRRPLVDGAPVGSYADEVTRTLVDPDAPGTAERLARLGVTAIVTRPGAIDFDWADGPDTPNASWGPGYSLLGRFPDGSSAWRVTADPAPALVGLPNDSFALPMPHEDGTVGHQLTGQTGRLSLAAAGARVVRLGFEAVPLGGTRTLTLAGRRGSIDFALDGRTNVSVVVELPRGRSGLELRVDPAPEAGAFPLELFGLRVDPAAGGAELLAEPDR